MAYRQSSFQMRHFGGLSEEAVCGVNAAVVPALFSARRRRRGTAVISEDDGSSDTLISRDEMRDHR